MKKILLSMKNRVLSIATRIKEPPLKLIKACAAGAILMSIIFQDHSYLLYAILFWIFIIDTKIDNLK